VNSKSPDKLDYRRYKNEGLHVIAIGGFALSRGFTLEGLTVSYFLRNSIMYDTLLQMGRWFGYRDSYADVCRIFMTEDAIDWYAHISDAIDELRDEFNRMEKASARPIDFGLKVRAHPESLIVTARNKMRSGQEIRHSISLAGELVETNKLGVDALSMNRDVLSDFLKSLESMQEPELIEEFGYVWKSMPVAHLVRSFISKFKNHDGAALITQAGPINSYIQLRESDEFSSWDVCLFSPKNGTASTRSFGSLTPNKQVRSSLRKGASLGSEFLAISGKALRVGSPGQSRAGMDIELARTVKDDWDSKNKTSRTVPDKEYLRYRTRPILMLHVLDILEKDGSGSKVVTETDVVGWGIGFPKTTAYPTTEVSYVVNTRWWAENYGNQEDDADED
jgi:hypothetical protein